MRNKSSIVRVTTHQIEKNHEKIKDSKIQTKNSPTFNIIKQTISNSDEVFEKMMNNNISKNIKANLKTGNQNKESNLSRQHKYSKTFTHIDEIPGVFTFINNNVNKEFSNDERSLSRHSKSKILFKY